MSLLKEKPLFRIGRKSKLKSLSANSFAEKVVGRWRTSGFPAKYSSATTSELTLVVQEGENRLEVDMSP